MTSEYFKTLTSYFIMILTCTFLLHSRLHFENNIDNIFLKSLEECQACTISIIKIPNNLGILIFEINKTRNC